MSRQITRWAPDTCDCVIEYEWDDANFPNPPMTGKKIVKACPFHSGPTPHDHFDKVLKENQRKNEAVSLVHSQLLTEVKNMPEFVGVSDEYLNTIADMIANPSSVTGENAIAIFTLSPSIKTRILQGNSVKWSFDQDRNVIIDAPMLSVQQKASARSSVKAKNSGKIVFKD